MSLAYSPAAPAAAPGGSSWPGVAAVIKRLGLTMTFAKDEEIFGQGEQADLLYLVVAGAVRTTRLLADGRRQIGAFYYVGDLVGLESGSTHRFSAEALIDSVVLVIKRSAFRGLADDAEFQRLVFDATRRELERAQEHLLVLGRKSACERVASFLMDAAQRHAGDDVALPMSRQDMADYLGLTIETVSRMVTHLQASNVVAFPTSRRFRVTSWAALAQLTE